MTMEEKMNRKYRTGAGIIVYQNKPDGIFILALEGPKDHQIKHDGKWDLPKGIIEEKEDMLDCAIRETYEEADYMVSKGDILDGPYQVSQCFMYLAPYDNIQTPKIKPNPMTGILEHDGWEWVNIDTFESNGYDWLRPFASWAKRVIKGS